MNTSIPPPPGHAQVVPPISVLSPGAVAAAEADDSTYIPPPTAPSVEYRPNPAAPPLPPREYSDLRPLKTFGPEKVYRLCMHGDVLPWYDAPVSLETVRAEEAIYARDPFGAEAERLRRDRVFGGSPTAYSPLALVASPSLPSARHGLTPAEGAGGGAKEKRTDTRRRPGSHRGRKEKGRKRSGETENEEEDAAPDSDPDAPPESERIAILEATAAERLEALRTTSTALREIERAHSLAQGRIAAHDVEQYARELGEVVAVAPPPDALKMSAALEAVLAHPENAETIMADALADADADRDMHINIIQAKIKFLVDEEVRIARIEQRLCSDS